jgi:hypothetical protein
MRRTVVVEETPSLPKILISQSRWRLLLISYYCRCQTISFLREEISFSCWKWVSTFVIFFALYGSRRNMPCCFSFVFLHHGTLCWEKRDTTLTHFADAVSLLSPTFVLKAFSKESFMSLWEDTHKLFTVFWSSWNIKWRQCLPKSHEITD